jgi:hypothetical protein
MQKSCSQYRSSILYGVKQSFPLAHGFCGEGFEQVTTLLAYLCSTKWPQLGRLKGWCGGWLGPPEGWSVTVRQRPTHVYSICLSSPQHGSLLQSNFLYNSSGFRVPSARIPGNKMEPERPFPPSFGSHIHLITSKSEVGSHSRQKGDGPSPEDSCQSICEQVSFLYYF